MLQHLASSNFELVHGLQSLLQSLNSLYLTISHPSSWSGRAATTIEMRPGCASSTPVRDTCERVGLPALLSDSLDPFFDFFELVVLCCVMLCYVVLCCVRISSKNEWRIDSPIENSIEGSSGWNGHCTAITQLKLFCDFWWSRAASLAVSGQLLRKIHQTSLNTLIYAAQHKGLASEIALFEDQWHINCKNSVISSRFFGFLVTLRERERQNQKSPL